MNIMCGTDIIEISRIKDSIESDIGERFKERVFSQNEVDYCESKKNQKYQHYAARFAAKEAIFKAISKELENKYDIEWKQIQIENDEFGKPFAVLKHEVFSKIENIDISMSHCKEYATATAVVIFKQ
ncbi:MAG: holo-ACP synthase [Clostridia bacterium]|nr:holo-ACP synthase [Clostridia bacterium]